MFDQPTTRRGFLKMTGGAAAAAAATVIPMSPARAAAPTTSADTVFVGGSVITTDARRRIVDALAVRGSTIVYVGDETGARRLIGRGTEVVDLAGGAVMPGIHDGHVHPLLAGRALTGNDLAYGYFTHQTLRTALQGMLDETRGLEPDGWFHAVNWSLPPTKPVSAELTSAILDGLDTTRPVVVRSSDYHTVLCNRRAFELAGITAATPDPVDGRIVRHPDGEPTGLLNDGALGLVEPFLRPTFASDLDALDTAIGMLQALGTTSLGDAWVEEWMLPLYARLRDDGRLRARTRPYLKVHRADAADPRALIARFASLAREHQGGRLSFGTVKIFMDGVIEHPLQTAAMIEPYLEKSGGTYRPGADRGPTYFEPSVMNALVTALDAAGWQAHVHAIGDRGTRVALDAFETALRRNGRRGNRHTIVHLEQVDPADVPRFAKLGVLANMQLKWAGRDEWSVDQTQPYIGDERWARLYPARSLRDAGAYLTAGSDWPVDTSTPFDAIATAVTRRYDAAGWYGLPLNPAQAIAREEAIEMHTSHTAFQLRQESKTGTLEPGKDADLIVIDRDITSTPIEEVHGTLVRATYIAGERVFDRGSASPRLQRLMANPSLATSAGACC